MNAVVIPIKRYFDLSIMPALSGTRNEKLKITIGDDPETVTYHIVAEFPCSNLVNRIEISSWATSTTSVAELKRLLSGNDDASFSLLARDFDLRIFVGTWGVRSGYVVKCTFREGNRLVDNWQDQMELAKTVLDGTTPALISNAFQCEYENLRTFCDELDRHLHEQLPYYRK